MIKIVSKKCLEAANERAAKNPNTCWRHYERFQNRIETKKNGK